MNELERFADAVTLVLGRPIGAAENFFDAGLDSLALERLHEEATRDSARRFPVTDLFAHPNLQALARVWGEDPPATAPARAPRGRAGAAAQVARRRRELRGRPGGAA